jgi:hypothetical protein
MNDPTTKPNKTILILSLAVALFILWRILVIGMSEYYVDKALYGDTGAIGSALSWNEDHPKAQYLEARQILKSDPEKAEALLTASLLENPTDTGAMQAMAELQFANGNKELANKFMLESTRLAPANKLTRIDAGFFWARTGQWDKAIENWRQALTTSPELGKQIYPVLMQIAENKESLILLKPLIENPPEWWDKFTEYLAKNAKNLDTVATVASLRKQSNVPLSEDERQNLVQRLMKDGQWPRAYIAWANGLDNKQIKYLGSIYDGAFKMEASNHGFGWHISKVKGVSIRKQRSYGSSDDKALLLTFDGKEMVFKHLFQPLYLTVGEHEFTANLKTDRLSSRGGLKWFIRCAGDEKIILGEGPRMLGSSEWRQLKFKFKVPDSKECRNGQILRLESTGQRTYDHILEGDIWFDRLTIRAVPKPATPLTTEQKAAKEKAAQKKAAKEKAAREQAAREKAAKEKAAREQATREKAAKEKAAREQAAREKAAREKRDPGEKFVKEIPAKAPVQISDAQVRELIATYSAAYETGNIDQMTALFTNEVKTDAGVGIEIIKNDYSKLFDNSIERRIKILSVTLDAKVQVRKNEADEWKNYSGKMTLKITRTDKDLLISGLSHSVSLDKQSE